MLRPSGLLQFFYDFLEFELRVQLNITERRNNVFKYSIVEESKNTRTNKTCIVLFIVSAICFLYISTMKPFFLTLEFHICTRQSEIDLFFYKMF